MIWNSWVEFAHMGGYGLYVWGSLGLVLIAMAVEILQLVWWRHALLHRETSVRAAPATGAEVQP